jgi:hypothetical protein
MASTLDRATEELARAAAGLDGLSDDVRRAGQLLALLGWELPPGVADIGVARIDVADVVARLRDLTELRSSETTTDLEIAAALAELAVAVARALEHLEGVAAGFEATPEYLAATDIVDEFFPRLADFLLIQLVGAAAPPAVPIGVLLGLFELTLLPADPAIFQPEHVRQVVRFDRIPKALTDPGGLFQEVYGWGTASFDGNTLVANLAGVLERVSAETRLRRLPRRVEEQLSGRAVPEADTDPATQVLVSLTRGLGVDEVDVGLALYPLRPDVQGGTDGGIGFSPYAFGTSETRFPLSERLALVLDASADLEGGVALLLRAGRAPELATGLIRPDGGAGGSFTLSLRHEAESDDRQTVFTLPGLRVDARAISAGIGVGAAAPVDPTLVLGIEDGRLRVAPDRADGFLASIVPADGITAAVELALSWSSREGVRIRGGAGLRTTIHLHSAAGPFRLDSLDLSLAPEEESLALTATVAGSVALGPFVASLDGIGAAAVLTFERGNLGPADLGLRFVPLRSLGLAVEAGPVTGGGFLRYDVPARRYSGVLDLKLGAVGVTGMGVLDARLPGGAPGFALLVAIRASFPPIEVGFGFALTSVGGLLALNRRVDVDALRNRLASGTAGRILAPEDPIRNAPSLLADLATVFPPAPGIAVVGPTLQLVWAKLVRFDIGIFIELPGPLRVVLLGSARATIDQPGGGRPYLVIRFDIVGVVDAQARTAAFDAVLIDSQLLEILDLTGGAAFRLSWGDRPYALLTVGGFNPAFNPEPAVFPASLTRVAMVHGTPSDSLSLRFEGYFAVTTNTLQFGAAVEAIMRAGNFIVQGIVGFDALIQFEPFHFQFDIRASVRVRYKTRNLAGLTLTGSLSGPGPVVLRGKVCIEILFFDICFEETFTLGSSNPPAVTPVPSAFAALVEEFARAANLHASETIDRYVALRPPPTGLAEPLVSPVGQLVWAQRRAPLDLLLQRIGGAPLATPELVEATGPDVAGPELDWFAPGSFADLQESEALNRRAFERLSGGVRVGLTGSDDGPGAVRPVTVRQIRLPAKATTVRTAVSFPGWLTDAAQVRIGAPRDEPVTPALAVAEEAWTVSDVAGGAVTAGLSQAQAHQLVSLGGAGVATASTDRIGAIAF